MTEKKPSKNTPSHSTKSVDQRLELIAAQMDATNAPALSDKAVQMHLKNQASTIAAIKEDHKGDRDLQKHSQRTGLISLGVIVLFLLLLCLIIAVAKPDLLDKILGYIFSFIGGAGFGGVGVSIYKSNQSKR